MDTSTEFRPEHEIELRRQQLRRMGPLARSGSAYAKRKVRAIEQRIRELERIIRRERDAKKRTPHLGLYQL